MPIGSEQDILDYFAARSLPPEPADICELMGWEKDLKVGDYEDVNDESGWRDSVLQRWHELPIATRLSAHAKFAYMYARAMMKARDE